MPDMPSILEGFKITSPSRYLLYLATVIFLASLFFQTQQIDIFYIRGSALVTIVYGLILWVGYDLVRALITIREEEIGGGMSRNEASNWYWTTKLFAGLLTLIWIAILIWFPIKF